MIRILLTIIVPLVLPTALYALWIAGAGPTVERRTLPLLWLGGTGLVLVVAVLAAVVEFGGRKDGVYVPPHLENGAIVDGHVEAPPRR